jgi:glycerol-3-phosphate dehydrogenase
MGGGSVKRDFDDFARERFDLVVVGGGIIGTGIARDAALRGLKALLLEKEDFAYGTTSRSTRLIHGGLRYLRQLEFRLVRQDMREREVLLGIAPHLVHPLRFVIPMTRHSERVVMALGMRLYDILSFDKSLPSFHHLSRRETLELEPDLQLDGLTGSYLYYDCQIPFAERLCLENVLSAAEHSASVANHAKVTGVVIEGDTVSRVQAEDTLSGEVYQIATCLVVNAAGPWMGNVLDMLYRHSEPVLRTTKGVHLLTPRICNNAMVLFAQADGRLFFTIPWQGYTLIGTTDTDYSEDPDSVHAEAEDVDYLLTEVRHAFPAVKTEDVFYTTAGLRALAGSRSGKASNVSRQHRLVDHEPTDGVKGLISVVGGKITGYRAIAREVIDLACRKLGVNARCTTAETLLPGAPAVSPEKVAGAAQKSGLSVETVAHLDTLYGSRLYQVLELARNDARGNQAICPHSRDILAQIWHATQMEGALTVSDFLLRRSAIGLAPCQGLDAVETVAQEMGLLLGWSADEQRRQIETYRSSVALSQRFRAGTGNIGQH